MLRFLSRMFGHTTNISRPAETVATSMSSPRAPVPDVDEPIADVMAKWSARDAAFWLDRTSYVLARLRSDWQKDSECAKWPDVLDLIDQLGGPAEEIVRQLPAAARDAMAICDSAALARTELADRLSRDPSLVQGLLRQANGAFYGAGLAPILRVDSAIDRIGVAGTRAVVLASCVDGLLSKPGGAYDVMLTAVWTHMVNTGPLARLIAPEFGADPEEAFSIALLHDVGKLVVFDRISALRTAKRRSVELPPAWLALALEQLHEPLGAVAAHRWGLGAHAADAIGAHHRRQRPAMRHPLAETLFLAERAEHASRECDAFDFDGVWSLGQLPGDTVSGRGILGRRLRAA